MVRGQRHVDVAALLDRLARVHRFEDRELARALLEDPRDAEQVLGALPARQLAPRPALGAAGGADRLVDIGRARAATSASGCSVDGSIETNVSPPVAGTDRPLMNRP